jgi:asparagine synthase (glutamine-hydrolysing)
MTLRIAHRGPDADGHWVPADTPVALGHRRLSILDLSPTGAQPMWSGQGRYVISFNGEIYNFRALRERLYSAGAAFRGTSDTEVLLAGFEAWGVAATLREATGMFALAVWDVRDQELYLARDRVGEKPLYYGVCGDSLVFASELKAIPSPSALQGRDRSRRRRAADAVRLRARAVLHLSQHRQGRPGTLLRFRPRDGLLPHVTSYWSAIDVARAGVARPTVKSDDRVDRRAGRAAPPRRRRSDGGRRPAGRVPLRWNRLDDRRRDDAGAVEDASAHVLDWVLRSEVRGSAPRARRWRRTCARSTPSTI